MPSSTNILHVAVETLDLEDERGEFPIILATTADRRLHLVNTDTSYTILESLTQVQDSPILSCAVLDKHVTITTGMSGQIVLYDHRDEVLRGNRRDHTKYIVKVIACEDSTGYWVATAGWDAKVFIYHIPYHNGEQLYLGNPVASLALTTNPETILFIGHPDSNIPILIVTCRDSTSLLYYALPVLPESRNPQSPLSELHLLGRQNLAPHSNAWVAFSPSSISLCPTDPNLLAVATSAVPHMKLLLVRLLLPSLDPTAVSEPTSQALQTRANLAIQDREDAAIQIHVSTMAPQTPYSTPQVCWRPDGSGVWVNGDDGVLRGIEAKTGRVVATLRDGHEVGSKIRSVWAGMVEVDEEDEEWVVSGGFDRRLVVWKIA